MTEEDLFVYEGKSLLSPRNSTKHFDLLFQETFDSSKKYTLALGIPVSPLEAYMKQKSYTGKLIFILPQEWRDYYAKNPKGSLLFYENNCRDLFQVILKPEDIYAINVLEWPPSAKAFGLRYKEIIHSVKKYLDELKASLMTTWYFSPSWFLNSLHNLSWPPASITSKGNLLLAASGPSLAKQIDHLQPDLATWGLAALPSSLSFLFERKLVPDIIFTSDGGYYADIHLRKYFAQVFSKGSINKKIYVITSLNSNIRCLKQYRELTVLTVNPQSFPLFSACPHIKMKDYGSVAFFALAFLQSFHQGPCVALGLDLQNYQNESHVKPHTFYKQDYCSSLRTMPLFEKRLEEKYSLNESGEWWQNQTLEIYTNWLLENASIFQGVFELSNPKTSQSFFPKYDLTLKPLPFSIEYSLKTGISCAIPSISEEAYQAIAPRLFYRYQSGKISKELFLEETEAFVKRIKRKL